MDQLLEEVDTVAAAAAPEEEEDWAEVEENLELELESEPLIDYEEEDDEEYEQLAPPEGVADEMEDEEETELEEPAAESQPPDILGMLTDLSASVAKDMGKTEEGDGKRTSSRHQRLVEELTGKLEDEMVTKSNKNPFAWLNTNTATDVKAWQTSAEGIRKLFEGKGPASDELTEISQPRGDVQGLTVKTRRLPKEWLVKCGRGDDAEFYSIELSPQNSYMDVQTFPLKIKLSEPDQAWGIYGSVRAIRGSAAQSMSAVPSRYTMQTIGSRFGRSKMSSSAASFRSENLIFDPKDEPIWQRGRRFDHPTDANNRHFVTIINTLNYDLKILQATQATVLKELKEQYRCYNPNIDNYVWKDIFEKQLNFDHTLHENGLVDNSYLTDDTGLRYFPLIFLFFDDGFLNDPPMQLDIRKAFLRDPDILCRNYQLGMLPEPEEDEMESWCDPDRDIQNAPLDVRREFRAKCEQAKAAAQRTPASSSKSVKAPSETLKQPSETLKQPSETLKQPSGALKDPSGALKQPSGALKAPSGTSKDPSGTVTDPSGTVKAPSGTVKDPSGTVKASGKNSTAASNVKVPTTAGSGQATPGQPTPEKRTSGQPTPGKVTPVQRASGQATPKKDPSQQSIPGLSSKPISVKPSIKYSTRPSAVMSKTVKTPSEPQNSNQSQTSSKVSSKIQT